MIHLFASEPHYERHVRAVWKHLPDDVRGEEFTGRAASVRGLPGPDYVMVGGFADVDRVQRHRLVYVEHGAGQSYNGTGAHRLSAFYPGGQDHPERIVAYICPRQAVADGWGRSAFAAGCPAIDDIVGHRVFRRQATITFHFDAWRVASEARSARSHWLDHLHEMVFKLVESGYSVVGHAHPRDRDAEGIWEKLQIPFDPDPDSVLTASSLLIADNTSLMYEAAALEIPVIVLNAPWYRRDVHHGLRFWDAVPGEQVDDIDQFLELDLDDYLLYTDVTELRTVAVAAAYDGPPDGHAGERAAQWLVETLGK